MMNHSINTRNSNLELLRIIAMLFVLLQHANFFSLGFPAQKTAEAFSFCLQESVTIIAVNLFILITGYFGTHLKMLKVVQLLYQCIFCVVPISFVLYLCGYINVKTPAEAFLYFWPFNYWYIVSYIGLMLIAPILNSYVSNVGKNSLKVHLLCFYLFVLIFDCVLREEYASILGGYSIVWMAFVYLVGRYIRIYNGLDYSNKTLMYVFAVTILMKSILLFFHINGVRYTNPTTFISSVAIFVAFTHVNFNNKYVNIIAASSTMAYLVNLHPAVIYYFRRIMISLQHDYNHVCFCILCLGVCLLLFIASVLYDRIRLVTWNAVTPFVQKNIAYFSDKIQKITI